MSPRMRASTACLHSVPAWPAQSRTSAGAKAPTTLRRSEEVLSALANSIPQLAWTAQADGTFAWYNERWHEYTDTTTKQMSGWGWQATHPEVLPAVL